uniref:Serine and arginine rich splicing factor 11 n=1 Tax=Molossus molossus TaxID=27622 RepID=A0A7J8FC79_MOLMO|nr:serine and arginine rich splicing factor 11 [Molossus molossus]
MSNTTVVPSTAGPGPSGGPGGGGGGGGTEVIQVTNVSPSASSEQMRTLFGFLGKIDELRLFPPDDSPLPVSSRVCFVKFHDPDSAVVAQHLTNTVFVDRALIVVPYAEGLCFVYLSMWASYDDHLPQYSFRVSISSMLKT